MRGARDTRRMDSFSSRAVKTLQTQAAAVALTLMLGVAAWLIALPGAATLTLTSASVLIVLLVMLVHARALRSDKEPHGRWR